MTVNTMAAYMKVFGVMVLISKTGKTESQRNVLRSCKERIKCGSSEFGVIDMLDGSKRISPDSSY